MRLVIEIDLDQNNLEEEDMKIFFHEAASASGIEITIGRPISEDESYITREFHLIADKFTTSLESVETTERVENHEAYTG
jgi:hypothetical protein